MTEKAFISTRTRNSLLVVLCLCAAGFGASLFLQDARAWPAFLLNAFFFLSLSLGAAVFVSIHHVSNAAWATALRRVPEAMMGYLPVAALSMLALFFGARSLYFEWVGVKFGAAGQPLDFKNRYLSVPFFFARMAVILAVWVAITFMLRRESRSQDRDAKLSHTDRSKKYSALFLVTFAVTFTVASFDWLMSLEPMFYSTIYAFYVLSGVLLSGVAAISILTILLRRRGLLPGVSDKHLHSLGKLLFGFATFWAYIWLCQYLLIYYANLPEETIYYYRRTLTPAWKTLFLVNIFLNWLIPFVLLLPQRAKRRDGWLLAACSVVLVGHWVDLYLMIFPVFGWSPMIGFVDVALTFGFLALFAQTVSRSLGKASLVPKNDPYLEESIWQEPEEVAEKTSTWGGGRLRALALSTVAFALTFAVWGIIGALAPKFREMYQLSAWQTSVLIAVPVLLGSVGRLPMGILADKFGGRLIFGLLLVFCLIPTIGVTFSHSYASLIAWSFLIGCAGTSFSVGVAFASKWFKASEQGTALGIYGIGNIGQSVAVFGAPALVAATGDWRLPFWIFGAAACAFGLVFLLFARNAHAETQPKKFGEYFRILKREPLAWVLSLFYFLTFGGFVALGIYLPTLLKDIFGLTPTDAGARVAGFVVVATLMRPVGGWLADRHGGAQVLILVLALIAALAFGLTSGSMVFFTCGALGCAAALGLGNGAVFKLVPEYFPKETGTVTGLVGAAGGLGGFFPPLVLGLIRAQTGAYTLGFVLLSAFALCCLAANYFVFIRRRDGLGSARTALAS